MSSTKHLRSLDGIRGIAIVLVLCSHSGELLQDIPHSRLLGFGNYGVDLFFVLSGFLITSILLRQKSQPHYFRNFYLRRALRIWPIYFLFLFSMFGLVALLPHLHSYQHLVANSKFLQENPLSIVTPLAVCVVLMQNLWWPSLFSFKDATGVTWSLCIEEQFYFVWPLIVKRLSPRALKTLLMIVIALQPLLRAIVFHYSKADIGVKWQVVTRFPIFHLDGIATGSLLALVWPDLQGRRETRVALYLLSLLCVPLAILFMRTTNPMSYTVAALISVCLTGMALLRIGERVLASAPLVFMGTISYGLYLIHSAVFLLFHSRSMFRMLGLYHHPWATELVSTAVAVAISIGLAALSRFTYEQFFLSLKDRRARPITVSARTSR
jgi:peptidoglycan/LPS O-acetylase OafA/YrhL